MSTSADEIRKLHELLTSGALTTEEFQKEKDKILSRPAAIITYARPVLDSKDSQIPKKSEQAGKGSVFWKVFAIVAIIPCMLFGFLFVCIIAITALGSNASGTYDFVSEKTIPTKNTYDFRSTKYPPTKK